MRLGCALARASRRSTAGLLPAERRSVPLQPFDELAVYAVPSNPLSQTAFSLDIEQEWRNLANRIGQIGRSLLLERVRPPTLDALRNQTAGRKALVLLSDGDDNASYMPYKDALEYARRSGVAVYVIGFNLGAFETGLRRKLAEIAGETGGRVFWASKAEELTGIYKEIENELRSRYLVAFYATGEAGKGGFREVEVKVKKGSLKARTARGYYQ